LARPSPRTLPANNPHGRLHPHSRISTLLYGIFQWRQRST
jgi:hypothetical protein